MSLSGFVMIILLIVITVLSLSLNKSKKEISKLKNTSTEIATPQSSSDKAALSRLEGENAKLKKEVEELKKTNDDLEKKLVSKDDDIAELKVRLEIFEKTSPKK